MKKTIELITRNGQLVATETDYREALVEDMARTKIFRMRGKPSRKAMGQLDAVVSLLSQQVARVPTAELRDFLYQPFSGDRRRPSSLRRN